MKLLKLNKRGFSHVEIFFFVLVIVGLGFVGYRVLNSNTSHAGSLCSGLTFVPLSEPSDTSLRCVYDMQVLVEDIVGVQMPEDGLYGEVTRLNVVAFQKKIFPNDSSKWDGQVGPITWSKLCNNVPNIISTSWKHAHKDACGFDISINLNNKKLVSNRTIHTSSSNINAITTTTTATIPRSNDYSGVNNSCQIPKNYPHAPNGGLTYVNWFFGWNSISKVRSIINIKNTPDSNVTMFIQSYDANIDSTGQYFGIQSIGLAIASRWGNNDISNVRASKNSYVVTGIETKTKYVSIRQKIGNLNIGTYTMTASRVDSDSVGDWFEYDLVRPDGNKINLGQLRFPRDNPSVPAGFKDGGGTWIEDADNNGYDVLYKVPKLKVSTKLIAEDTLLPVHVSSYYSKMPNSDISYNSNSDSVTQELGGDTNRCNSPGWLY